MHKVQPRHDGAIIRIVQFCEPIQLIETGRPNAVNRHTFVMLNCKLHAYTFRGLLDNAIKAGAFS